MRRCESSECIAPATVELEFEEVRCVATGETAKILFCRRCFDRIDQRLGRVSAERNELLASGVDRRMADHIMAARVDRRAV